MKTLKRIVTLLLFLTVFLAAFFSTGAVRVQRIWKWYDQTRLQSDTVTVDSLLVTRFFLLKSLTSAPFESAGAFYFNTTADPGTAYYHNGTDWLALGYAAGGAGDSSWHEIEVREILPFGAEDTIKLGLDADDTVRVRARIEFFEDIAVGTWASNFSQTVWDAIQDTCDSVLYADSSFHAYKSDTTDTAHFAWNSDSLGGVEAAAYLFATTQDTATAELFFADTLHIDEDIYILWAYPDEYAWTGYTGGTWILETKNNVDILIKGDSLVFQTIGEGNNRGVSFLDSSGTVIAYFTNDGDLVFNPSNAADIWLLDTLSAAEYSGVKEYVSDTVDQVRSEMGDSAEVHCVDEGQAEAINEPMLNCENSPTDEYVLTYESDGEKHFQWYDFSSYATSSALHDTADILRAEMPDSARAVASDTANILRAEMPDSATANCFDDADTEMVKESHLFTGGQSPTDEYVLSYEATGTKLEWVEMTGGAPGDSSWEQITTKQILPMTEDTITAGANATDDTFRVRAVLDVRGEVLFEQVLGVVSMKDNQSAAFAFKEAANSYLTFLTTDGSEAIDIEKKLTLSNDLDFSGAVVDVLIRDNQATALEFKEDGNAYITFITSDGSEAVQTNKPLNISGNYTLPTADGGANEILKTNGSGTVTWETDATGGGGGGRISENFVTWYAVAKARVFCTFDSTYDDPPLVYVEYYNTPGVEGKKTGATHVSTTTCSLYGESQGSLAVFIIERDGIK